jgi:hypothetical protein
MGTGRSVVTEHTRRQRLNDCERDSLSNDDGGDDATEPDAMSSSSKLNHAVSATLQANAGSMHDGVGLELTNSSGSGAAAESWETLLLGKSCKDGSHPWCASRFAVAKSEWSLSRRTVMDELGDRMIRWTRTAVDVRSRRWNEMTTAIRATATT